MQDIIRLDRLNNLLNNVVEDDPSLVSTLILNSQKLDEFLLTIGLELNITGAVVLSTNGEYLAVWLTESNRPDWLGCYYHPLPYFHSTRGVNIPYCEMEINGYYQRS